jgi:hypothetical protein
MKYLVQKIRKKERPQSESEYVQRLREEETGLGEVRVLGIPTQGQIQQDPTGVAMETATTLAAGPIINTAKGPILAAAKKIGQQIPGKEIGNIAKGAEASVHALLKRFGKEKEFSQAIGQLKSMEEKQKFSSGVRDLLIKKMQETKK